MCKKMKINSSPPSANPRAIRLVLSNLLQVLTIFRLILCSLFSCAFFPSVGQWSLFPLGCFFCWVDVVVMVVGVVMVVVVSRM
jgi:hypothetical protein